jgi:NADH-quinone oxidoreductase subunit F
MDFEAIRTKAISEWESLGKSTSPVIFIGTATCGRAAGADTVLEAINAALERHKIKANITQVGCLGLCYAEPLVDIIKPGRPRIHYGNLTPTWLWVLPVTEGYPISLTYTSYRYLNHR